MLPTEFLRARKRQGKITPLFAGEEKLSLAKTLISVFKASVNRRYGELKAALSHCEELGYNFKLVRGLSSILEEHCIFETRASVDPPDARAAVFDEVGGRVIATGHERKRVLASVASRLNITAEELDASLYADLSDEQVPASFDAPEPMELLREYNFAMIVALLTQARRVELVYRGRLELGEPLGRLQIQDGKGTSKIIIENPSSKRAGQHASEFERLLSSLMLLQDWGITAEHRYGGKAYLLELSKERNGKLVTPGSLKLRARSDASRKGSPEGRPVDEIVLVEEFATGLGVTEAKARERLRQTAANYIDLGGVFITPKKLKELEKGLETSPDMRLSTVTEALRRLGCRKPLQVLEALGYAVEWAENRDLSRVYRLRKR